MVGWNASPNVSPGSTTSPSPGSHGGRIVIAPTVTGSRWACQAVSQPGSTGAREIPRISGASARSRSLETSSP